MKHTARHSIVLELGVLDTAFFLYASIHKKTNFKC